MALIECPQCGKSLSDKASKCLFCGYENIVQEVNNHTKCSECGHILEHSTSVCPVCGCPVENQSQEAESIQRGNETKIHTLHLSKKNQKTIIIAVILFALVIIGIVIGVFISNKNSKSQYQENLSLAATTMLSGAANAEDAGRLIHDVWYNTIYEKSDARTDKYTKNAYGSFNSDFNNSILLLMVDEDFSNNIQSIKDNQGSTDSIMKNLVNPPEEFQEAYNKLQELYSSYLELTNLVINPTGSLSSYTNNFNNADTATSNAYKAIQIYIE